jgi:outer membrane murein-binding lipoprotein Lpp
MKTLNRILLAAVLATTFSLAGSANAQYKVNEDDGIAASPKVRQMLNERKAARAQPAAAKYVVAFTVSTKVDDGIAASPRLRQQLAERKAMAQARSTSGSTVASAGYKATGSDGITASPRTRQQLNERSAPIMVAPVK